MTRASIFTLVLLAGCNPAPAPTDAGRLERCGLPFVVAADTVDLLLVIDNSHSIGEEQVALAAQVPHLVEALASGDRNGDGVIDFTPVDSLHVGVVTTDMGSGGFDVPTCGGGTFGVMHGDDGVLLGSPRPTGTCAPSSAFAPGVFEFRRGADPLAFGADVACLVGHVGTTGCGFEQQLEAPLKALSASSAGARYVEPGYVPPTFFGGSLGHGDAANVGLLRDDSVLAIVLLTDEEDCSWADPDLVNPRSTTYPGNLNLRCLMYPDAVQPTSRYVHGTDGHGGFLGLRWDPRFLVFAAITGVPEDLVPDPLHIDYDAVLADARMVPAVDPAIPTRLSLACSSAAGSAPAARRIVTVARDIERAGGGTTVQSICASDFGPAIDGILGKIGEALGTACVPTPDPSADRCAALRAPDGATPLRCDPATRLCRVSCASDADCSAAGLLTDRSCDPGSWDHAVRVFADTDPVIRDQLRATLVEGGITDFGARHAYCVSLRQICL